MVDAFKILVVGGLNGFVGSNTTEALVEQGFDCVVTRHADTEVPRFLQKYIDRRVFVEPADATSLADLRRIGEKHKIDGIVNVAGGFRAPGTTGPVSGLKGYYDMLYATFRVAEEWKVKRLTFSSTGGIYLGLPGPLNEELPVPLPSPFPIISYQKIVEVATSEFAKATGISSICVRITGMFGPGQSPTQGNLAQRLVLAAVSRKPPSLEGVRFGHVDDATERCYIKDTARAIALLQTAEKLPHDVYNIGSGKLTSNRELVNAIEEVVPGFKYDLPPGRSPGFPPMPVMDTERLRADTGFSPSFDARSAVRNYAEWIKAGNPR